MPFRGLTRFNSELRSFADGLPGEFVRFQRLLGLELLRRVVQKTPVDTGRARGNWQVELGFSTEAVLDQEDLSGAQTIASGAATLAALEPFGSVFIFNNLPYILVLEDGLFQPPSPGPSSDPRPGRSGRVLVEGGFSTQAPGGMLSLSLQELREAFPG